MHSTAVEKIRSELACVVEAELAKCARCGSCASVCPVFAEKNSEAYCARGKLLLAQGLANGTRKVTERLSEIFQNCLVCMACVKQCGNGVRMDRVIPVVREVLTAEGCLPLWKHVLYRHVLPEQATLHRVMQVARRLEPIGFVTVPENSGLRRRFPVPFLAEDQPVPRIAKTPFRERVPERMTVSRAYRSGELVYFTGCAAQFLFPTIGESIVHVLRVLGYAIHVPAMQQCCGTPMEIGGEKAVAVELARRNIAVLSSTTSGPILVGCGSGGFMLRDVYPRLLAGREQEKAVDVARRVVDVSEFLADEAVFSRLVAKVQRKIPACVTYHDPCHLARGMGVTAQPRKLLRAVATPFVEMPDAGRCCGSGGLYGATHWPVSQRILSRKTGNVAATCAGIVATGCPSCFVQLEAGLAGTGMQAMHTAELLAWSLGYLPECAEEAIRFRKISSR